MLDAVVALICITVLFWLVVTRIQLCQLAFKTGQTQLSLWPYPKAARGTSPLWFWVCAASHAGIGLAGLYGVVLALCSIGRG
ncbi:MAG: Hok/Gef family protein [Verrucomicrobium sp.]